MNIKTDSTGDTVEILIVEDSPTQAERLKYFLEQKHYRVMAAENGKEALALLSESLPTLIITDIIMPEMNGYELCKRIKADERTREIPVILLTSLVSSEDVLEGLACGADNFITKPYSEEYLLSSIERILASGKLHKTERVRIGMEITFAGERRFITADQQQMLSLLISTYEAAVLRNTELSKTQDELRTLNERLEELVEKRTAALSAEIAERKRIEEALTASEKKYRDIYNNAYEGIYQTTPQGQYLSVNPSFARMAGYDSPEDMIRSVTDIGQQLYVNPEDRERLKDLLTRYGAVQNFEAQVYHRNGSKLWISMNVHTVKDAEENVLYYEGTNEDITYRKNAEKHGKKETDRIKFLLQLYSMAPQMPDRELFDCVLEKIVALTESAIGFFHRVDNDDTIILTSWNDEALKSCTANYDNHYPLNQAGNWVDCFRYQKPVIYNDFPNSPHQKGLPEGHAPIKRYMSVPIMGNDFSFIFGVGNKEEEYDDYDVDQLQILANELYKLILARKTDTDLRNSYHLLRATLLRTVQAMAAVVETRDPYTAGHQRRVADLARAVAKEMALSPDQAEGIWMACSIHDLGKISVPAEILSKPITITALEFSLIKTHVQSGYDILKDIDFPWPIARIVLEHHEKMNGAGYPHGLLGEDTLLESRILTVADVVEAMASHRPYRPALGIGLALEEISRNRGILYDPTVVDACLRLFNEKGYKIID